MYNISFYKDKKGNEPVKQYIVSLKEKNTKDSLIKLNKIHDYLNILKQNGTRAGMPFVRHIKNDLWELRPLKDRFFFFTYDGNDIILLSYIRKMTQKTPSSEIKKAIKLMNDYIERSAKNE